MIDLTDKDVSEFRAIYRKETGRDITMEEAREYASNLIRLVAMVLDVEKHLGS